MMRNQQRVTLPLELFAAYDYLLSLPSHIVICVEGRDASSSVFPGVEVLNEPQDFSAKGSKISKDACNLLFVTIGYMYRHP